MFHSRQIQALKANISALENQHQKEKYVVFTEMNELL